MATNARTGGIRRFDIVETLGQGAFGTVYLIEREKELFALKAIDLRQADEKQWEMAEEECEVLKMLLHDHVVMYVDSALLGSVLQIVTEYCEGGDMAMFLRKLQGPVPEDLLRVWLYQMGCALEYLHLGHPVILHRDLKPSNIYLTKNGDIKVGDLGVAKILEHPKMLAMTFCGTPCYMSPEMLQENPYSSKTDIWSLGCCLVEMATAEKVFNGTSLITLIRVILNHEVKPLPLEVYGQKMSDLVAQMMSQDPDKRLSATDILNHSLLQETFQKGKTPHDLLEFHELLPLIKSQSCDPGVAGSERSRTTDRTTLSSSITDESFRSFDGRKPRRVSGRVEEPTIRYDPSTTGLWRRNRKHSKKDLSPMFDLSSSSSDDSTVVQGSKSSQSVLSGSLMTSVMRNMTRIIGDSLRVSPAESCLSVLSRTPDTALDHSLASQLQLLTTLGEMSLGTESFSEALQSLSSVQDPQVTMGTLSRLMGEGCDALLPAVIIVALTKSFMNQPR